MRLYNGCPDDELQAVWDERDSIRRELRKLGVRATWYPAEQKYMGWRGGAWYDDNNVLHHTGLPLESVTGMCDTLQEVLREAKEIKNAQAQ